MAGIAKGLIDGGVGQLIVAGGELIHQGSTEDASTHRAIEAVFANRLRVVWCEERWLALPQ